MKKASKKSTPKVTLKPTPKMPRHLLTGWIVFDPVSQLNYEINSVIDGVAIVTPHGGTFQHAIALDRMRSDGGHPFNLFPSRKVFEAFTAIHYPKVNS